MSTCCVWGTSYTVFHSVLMKFLQGRYYHLTNEETGPAAQYEGHRSLGAQTQIWGQVLSQKY